MTDAKMVHVKDIALGVLVGVLGLFFYYFAWSMTNYISLLDFIIVMVCLWFGKMFFYIGYTFIMGITIDLS